MTRSYLRDEIREFIAKNSVESRNQVALGIHRNKNNVLEEIEDMIKNGEIFVGVESKNSLTLYQDTKEIDKSIIPLYAFSSEINYQKLFSKWKNKKLTKKDRIAVYSVAMNNILPKLDTSQIFLWFSCSVFGTQQSERSERLAIRNRNEINQILQIVKKLDNRTCEIVKGAVKSKLLDRNTSLFEW